jgi:phosphoribosylformylglycinamidine synthase
MALAGDTGVALTAPEASHAFWFGEEQARYVLAVPNLPHMPGSAALLAAAEEAGIPAAKIGHADGSGKLTHSDTIAISLSQLREAHERFFPSWFAL